MARAYTTATAALALDLPVKWVDNVISHFRISGVEQARQGIARRLSVDAVLVLSVISMLGEHLKVPTARALDIAQLLVSGQGQLTWPDGVQLSVDLKLIRAQLLDHLAGAVEVAPVPRRGRPPRNTTGRLE
jgi:hypothetical protein